MFDDIPRQLSQLRPPTIEEEGWRYTQGDKNARRPPELLTRDHVARCIMREVREGRGSPHGGVFLDIAWIKEKLPNAAEHIKKKLPSMYHQFKQLADIDITQGADGSRPDHALHDGRRARGCRHADVRRARACSRRANAPRACTARTGWAEIRSPICSSSASAPASTRRSSPRKTARARSIRTQVDEAARAGAGAVRARRGGRPYQVQHDLQDMMQDLVGIVRREEEMEQALGEHSRSLSERARRRSRSTGNREYNPGWHTALDLTIC